jgi:hypothetical protein
MKASCDAVAEVFDVPLVVVGLDEGRDGLSEVGVVN